MSVSPEHSTAKKQITKSSEYLALSTYIAEIAQDPDFSGILTPKKANKLQNLSIDLVNALHCDPSVKSILTYCFKLICKRPNLKDMYQLYSQNLAKVLGLDDGAGEKEILDCVNSLRAKNEANVSLKVENVRLNQTIEDLKNQINALSASLAVSQERNQEMMNQIQEFPDMKKMNKIISKTSKQAKELEDELNKVKESENMAKAENDLLKQKIALLEAQTSKNPEIEELKSKLETKENEKQKLIELFDELTSQFNSQAEELNKDANTRNTLITAVHKLTSMNQYLSDKLAVASKKVDSLCNEKAILQSQVNKCELPHQFIEEMSTLKDSIISVVPEDLAERINPILSKESDSYGQRVVKTISSLVEYFENKEKLVPYKENASHETNDSLFVNALKSCVLANIKYLNDLVESKDRAQWIVKPYAFEEIRNIIVEQITRINNFLSELHLIPSDEQSVFESLMLDVDQIDSHANLSTLLENFVKPETTNERILFLYVIQAIAINDVIRKFAFEIRAQCGRQVTEIKQLRNELESGKANFDNKLNDETMFVKNQMTSILNENDELKQKIQDIRTKLTTEFSNGTSSSVKKQLIEIIDGKQDETTEEEDEEEDMNQSNSLIHLLEHKSEEVSNLQEELSKLSQEKKELQKQILKMNEEKVNSDNENVAHIAKIETLLRSTEENLESQTTALNEQITALKNDNEKLVKQLNDALMSDEAEKKIEEQENTIRILKKDKKTLARSLAEQQEAAQEAIEHVIEKSKAKNEKLKAEFTNICNDTARVISEHEKVIKENEEKLKSSEARINEFSKLTSELQSELTQTKTKVSGIEIEKKMLASKLSCLEEKAKREKSLVENQYKLKIMSIETECQSRLDSQKARLEGELNQLINYVVDSFHECKLEENQQVSKDTAMELIQSVSEQLETYKYIEKQLNDARAEISAARKSLSTSKNDSLSVRAAAVADELAKTKETASQLEAKIKGMKREVIEARSLSQQQKSNQEWEDWARKINMLVSDGYCSISTPKELRFTVEEIVFAAMDKKLTWSRINSLRAQKKILTSGMNLTKAKGETLKSVISIAIAVHRLQKLSGHIQTKLSVPIPSAERNQQRHDVAHAEKKPLFTQFITKQ